MNCPQALGYNHDVLINARDSDVYDRFFQGKVDVNAVPPSDYAEILNNDVMPIAPVGLSQVQLTDGSSTSANEAALTTAMINYVMAHGKQGGFANFGILGFSNGAHGSSVATLSCSDPAVNVSNVPTYDWPVAPLPDIQYPYAANEHENIAEEQRCLEETSRIIQERRDAGKDVAAMIVEPISGLGMNNATPNFYKGLRKIAKDAGIPFIVDETRTGFGQTGKMWAHELWYLQERDGGAPDMVTFGGKAGISGFYSTYEQRWNPAAGSLEQTVDMTQVLNYGIQWRFIQKKGLLELVQDTSSFLKIELENAARDHRIISNVRGLGTAIAFDTVDAESMQSWLLKRGIVV